MMFLKCLVKCVVQSKCRVNRGEAGGGTFCARSPAIETPGVGPGTSRAGCGEQHPHCPAAPGSPFQRQPRRARAAPSYRQGNGGAGKLTLPEIVQQSAWVRNQTKWVGRKNR